MKIVGITQARLSSTRFPGKILKPLGSGTVLGLHLKRIKQVVEISNFIVAAATEDGNEKIKNIALANGFDFFEGDKEDVLDRFYQAAKTTGADVVIRLTSDCPLIDPCYIKDLIIKFNESGADYATNCLIPNLPDGMDAEIFTFSSLKIAWENAKLKSDREHVTPFIRNSGLFKILSVDYSLGLGEYRMTLDTEEDYNLLKVLVERCGENNGMMDYVNYLKNNPEIKKMNSKFERNEGYQKSLKGDS